MTVAELISALEALPADAPVMMTVVNAMYGENEDAAVDEVALVEPGDVGSDLRFGSPTLSAFVRIS